MTLVLEDVYKHYDEGGEIVRAVDGVSLRVDIGEMVTLSGPSGAGKTTLLLLACGLDRPDQGRVTFEGRELSAMSRSDAADFRREEVGILLQSFNLIPARATENAALKLIVDRVPITDARRRAEHWLKRVGLERKINSRPDKMSGGERQRVALVRALLGQPRLVVADEPTGHLDTTRARDILCLLRDFAHREQAAVLVISHDPQAAEIADRSFTLKDGKLASTVDASPATRSAGAT